MRRETEVSNVPMRARPTLNRAAAAARSAGAPAGDDAVAERMRHAARRARSFTAPSPGVSGAAALAVAPAPRPAPRRDEQPRPRHLRVVPDGLTPAQRRRRARALLMAGIGGAAVIGMALVYFHVVLAQRQFALDRLQSQVQQAQATYQQRRLEVAQLGSPQHIISMAEGQLGMVQPAKVTYLTPSAGGAQASGTGGIPALGPSAGTAAGSPSQALAGDANWPKIKSQLAGMP